MTRQSVLTALVLAVLTSTAQAGETPQYPVIETGQIRCYAGNEEIGYPKAGETYNGQDAQFASTPFAFVDNGDGTVTDSNTGLMWQQVPSSRGFSWQGAVDYCSSLKLAGHDDWRLSDVKELQSIVDYSGVFPAIDPLFTCSPITNEARHVPPKEEDRDEPISRTEQRPDESSCGRAVHSD